MSSKRKLVLLFVFGGLFILVILKNPLKQEEPRKVYDQTFQNAEVLDGMKEVTALTLYHVQEDSCINGLVYIEYINPEDYKTFVFRYANDPDSITHIVTLSSRRYMESLDLRFKNISQGKEFASKAREAAFQGNPKPKEVGK